MIPAFITKPKGSGPFPVVIDIHGGPEGQAQPFFNPIVQYYANEMGIAVIEPNVRGSSGYGKSFLQLDNGFKREESVQDIGKLLDWIATQPDLDPKRVAVTGGSYGGYMVLASMTHFNDRLKCAVDIVGISNFVTFLTNTQDYRRDLRRVEYGDERDPKMNEFLQKISPTTNAHKITKPLFVVQGLNDPRVPYTEAEQIVDIVRKNSGEVWYLLAKDEGHGFRKKTNRDFYIWSEVLFLEKYLLK
jgi:dipeptidyl aminopeptidase/acylaminoacyl peptidase